MTLCGEGTVFHVGKTTVAIRIPLDVARDSQFPFKVGEAVVVYVKDGKVVVERLESGRTSNIHNQ